VSIQNDRALYESDYERNENERYFTEGWVTRALVKHLPDYVLQGKIWEPAAGRGDMAGVLMDQGCDVECSDIDMTEFNLDPGIGRVMDFLKEPVDFAWSEEYSAIITNPPYGGGKVKYEGKSMEPAEAFVRKALDTGIPYVAMVLRSEFSSASGRMDLFRPGMGFAYEIVLTTRPRWDWWFRDKPKSSPRHNFSIFVWDREWEGPSTQFWECKE
jgi:predicted RNA methylase